MKQIFFLICTLCGFFMGATAQNEFVAIDEELDVTRTPKPDTLNLYLVKIPFQWNETLVKFHRGDTIYVDSVGKRTSMMFHKGEKGYFDSDKVVSLEKYEEFLQKERELDSAWTRIVSVPRTHIDWMVHRHTWPVYAILALCLFSLAFFSEDSIGRQDWDYMGWHLDWTHYLSIPFFILAACLILYYVLGFQGDRVWFIIPQRVGWLGSVIGAFLLLPSLFGLTSLYSQSLAIFDFVSGRKDGDSVGGVGAFWTLIALSILALARLFFQEYEQYVMILILAIPTIQILYMGFRHLLARGNIFIFIANVIFYLFGLFVLLVLSSTHIFMHLAVMVALANGMAGSVPASEKRCGNCRTYRNGYCYFQKRNVSSDSSCSSHEF